MPSDGTSQPERSNGPALDQVGEQLYDEYLEAAALGEAPDPEAFLAERGAAGDALLLSLLQAVHQRLAGGFTSEFDHRPLGDFVPVRILGEGGMGVVHLARQLSLDRFVALKVLRPEIARSNTAAVRLEREARAAAKLVHPNIVAVYAVGEARGVRFLAMEFVEGQGLDEVLDEAAKKGERLPVPTVLRWGAELARALDYAHGRGIVHRDVKPSNIRIGDDGRPRLLDFGIARDLRSELDTLTEAFVGSPHYVAPEQVGRGGGRIDGRADVYALGVVLFECLTGRTPFLGGTLEQVLHDILTTEPPSPRTLNPALAPDIQVVVGKAMEKDPDRRYSSAGAFAADLEALLAYRPIAARGPGLPSRVRKWTRRRPVTATLVLAALALFVAVASLLVGQRLAAERQRRDEVDGLLARAKSQVAWQEDEVGSYAKLESQFQDMLESRFTQYFSPERERQFTELEDAMTRRRVERDANAHATLDLLHRAEDLGAAAESVRTLRAQLYIAMHDAAELANDSAAMKAYLDLARENDPREVVPEVQGSTHALAIFAIPGAELHVFRMMDLAEVVAGAEHRFVPLPCGYRSTALDPWAYPEMVPGAWALEVVRQGADFQVGDLVLEVAGHPIRDAVLVACDHGELRRGDRLFAIDGQPVGDLYAANRLGNDVESARHRFEFNRGDQRFEITWPSLADSGIELATPCAVARGGAIAASVWRDGSRQSVELPPGLALRTTAAPVVLGEASRIGEAPENEVLLDDGPHLIVARKAGYLLSCLPVRLKGGGRQDVVVELVPESMVPEEFVFVPPWRSTGGKGFLIMEREVTLGEYLEFLNDPAVRAEIEASPTLIRVPRSGTTVYCAKDENGMYLPPEGTSLDVPAFGLSWRDAHAYSHWRTDRATAAGEPFVFELPTANEWSAAGGSFCPFVYGERFRPKWFSSCFTRPTPGIEPGMRFPIDRSAFGVYDLTGSVCEWTADWWREEVGQRFLKGGSWAHAGPEERFRLPGGIGQREDFCDGTTGVRLVLRLTEPAP
ncbi:MAG: protein kinase [Phycisphaerales bacterium]|nr:protein kinase [Phycisphaerales bacterium]